MAAPRRVIELAISDEDAGELARLARSRTEPSSRVARARMLLAYRQTPSFYAVGRAIGVTHQTVERCLRRAERLGVMAALDDSPRPGREPVITDEARTLWSTWHAAKPRTSAIRTNFGRRGCLPSTFANTPRRRGTPAWPARAGHVVQDPRPAGRQTAQSALLSRAPRPGFDAKMAEVLCVYREVELLKQSAVARDGDTPAVAIISFDEKPGLQAIGTSAPDLPPARRACGLRRDHEYIRHGTLSLLAGIDLFTGVVHASVEDRHRSREFVAFLKYSTQPIRQPPRSN